MPGDERLKCHLISGYLFRQWSVGIGFLPHSARPNVTIASGIPGGATGRAVTFLGNLSSPGFLGILGLH